MADSLIPKLTASLKKYYHDELGIPNYEEHIQKRILYNEESIVALIQKIERYVGSLIGARVLSIGSGWGEFALVASNYGAIVTGIEPDKERLEIANLRSTTNCTFIEGYGESLPFLDNSFDFIECQSVLEHVQDIKKVIAEIIRVLKVGGSCYIQVPNYFYPTESHYKILWLPMMPKSIAKVYLKLRGRNPKFIETINYTNPILLRKILKSHNNILMFNIGHPPKLYGGNTIKQKIKRKGWNLLVGVYSFFGIEEAPIEVIIKKCV